MSDLDNSDDERYANESFENETDNEIPEIQEIESETNENSEDEDALPSIKMSTVSLKRNSIPTRLSISHNTDTVPFASSSDEEDDVIVGETLAEINTPSMHFEEELTTTTVRNFAPLLQDIKNHFTNEGSDCSDEFSVDEDDEEEFNKIKEMKERYIQQNSAKMPKNGMNTLVEEENPKDLTKEADSEEQETDTETEGEEEEKIQEELLESNTQNNRNVNPIETEQSYEEHNSEISYNTETDKILPHNLQIKCPFDQETLVQMIQNSLANLNTSSSTTVSENDIVMTSQMLQPPVPYDSQNLPAFNLESSNLVSPEYIAMALVNAIKSTCFNNLPALSKEANDQKSKSYPHERDESKKEENSEKSEYNHSQNINNDKYDNEEFEEEAADKEEEIEVIQNKDYAHYPDEDEDDRDVYYSSHFDYRITSKTPSSFNSDDYIFHANFIKSFHRNNSTDKFRPHHRKNMSFTNERMREIERHNQILLRKILTQKPTYTAKNKSGQQLTLQKAPSQTNIRATTSAVNRKKQQRQIDLDNQVLKRKIETISLRRRPLIS